MSGSHQLALLDKARTALAEVRQVGDALEIRDQAKALEFYFAKHERSVEAALHAAEIRIRAERRIGELLPKKQEGKRVSCPAAGQLPRQRASEFRAIAEVPAEAFEEHLATSKAKGSTPTTAGVLKLGKQIARAEHVEEVRAKGGKDTQAAESLDSLVESVAMGAQEPFGCVYIDPPWPYDNQGSRGATDNHYPTMPLDDIAALPIADLVGEQAHLHLWTTSVFLPECFDLMLGWGFHYKSYLTWDKPQFGLGNYWRGPCELLLLGVRGSCEFLRHNVKAILREDRTRHSAKPAAFRELIEEVSPGPRLEMFARAPAPGWTSWGNEVASA